jgi:cell wall-associated NlpC family hydrolase
MTLSEYALKFVGRPYIWGGDGSGKCDGGFDCSGLVLECLWAMGIMPKGDMTAQGLYKALCKKGWVSVPAKAVANDDILFFGKDDKHITHVAIAIGNGLMVEAGGGSSKCKTAATSTGMVRVRPITWRKDLVAVLRE